MKRTIYFIIGCFAFLLVNLIFSNYGNKEVHRNINSAIIEKFKSNLDNEVASMAKFEKYTFRSSSTRSFKGKAITAGGQFNIKEELSGKNTSQWIIHGGYSADEPEVQASVRHFYNPTKPEGERYLQDHLDFIKDWTVPLTNEFNVSIDHLEWSLHHEEHEYNWDNGKALMENAIYYPNQDEKSSNLASAFRALGETLHMIADLGCPAHVRDDAHPVFGIGGYAITGSPDIYEEEMEGLPNVYELFGEGNVDPNLQRTFDSAETIEEIAKTLAVFSNKNFFTNQTITGSKRLSIIHTGFDCFTSPWLEECSYNESEFTFTKNIAGAEVIMCKDNYYSYFSGNYRDQPYFDTECVKSQAAVLIPQIMEAGAHVFRLFMPALEVEILSVDQETKLVKGQVNHLTDAEYPKEIKYNGEVILYDADSRKEVAKSTCLDGNFEFQLSNREFNKIDWEKDGAFAGFWLGDFFIESDAYVASGTSEDDPEDVEGGEDYCEIGGVKYYYTETGQLNLSNNNLTELPDCIDGFVNITQFNIQNNKISTLPSSIGNLTNLTYLNLSKNQLTGLPESIGKLLNVGQIDLNDNKIVSLPSSIGNMSKLGVLNLDNNSLNTLPDNFSRLKLWQLRIVNNQLKSLPSDFGTLSNLEALYLWDNNLNEIPESIGDLAKINTMDFSNNQLSSIPKSIGKLKTLQYLSFSGNHLTDLPEEIKNLRENLVELHMENNDFEEFDTKKDIIGGWLPNTKIYW